MSRGAEARGAEAGGAEAGAPMTAAPPAASARLLMFQVGEQEFCLDVTSLKEIRGWSQETLIPDAPRYVRGVINLRGSVLPIIDMAARLDLPACAPTTRHAVVVVTIGTKLVGLLVDAVRHIVTVPRDSFQPTPDLASGTIRDLVSALVSIEGNMIGMVALAHVMAACDGEGDRA